MKVLSTFAKVRVASSNLVIRSIKVLVSMLLARTFTFRVAHHAHHVAHHIFGESTARIDALYIELGRAGQKNGRSLSDGTLKRVHVVLRPCLAHAQRAGWIWDNPAERAHRLVTVTSDDEGVTAWKSNRVTKTFLRYRRRAGLRDFRLHNLRHFMATEMLEAGVPIVVVSRRLDHRRVSTTLDRYAHVYPAPMNAPHRPCRGSCNQADSCWLRMMDADTTDRLCA